MDFLLNVDYCLSELHDTRTSDCLDLSTMVHRLGIASLETGCWGQMIRKIPETGPRQWSTLTSCRGRSASKGWISSMLDKHINLFLTWFIASTLLNIWWCGQLHIHFLANNFPENPCSAIMSTSHRAQNIALVGEEQAVLFAKCFCLIGYSICVVGFLKGYCRGYSSRGFV